MSRWHNTFLNNQCINKEVKRETKIYLETNENGNTTYQSIWNAAKAVQRGKFIAIDTYIKKKKELK